MCGHDHHATSRHGLFLPFGLLALLALLATAMGGLYLMTGQVQPEAAKPLSETGEIFLCYGSLNLLLLYSLFWQVQRWSKAQNPAEKS